MSPAALDWLCSSTTNSPNHTNHLLAKFRSYHICIGTVLDCACNYYVCLCVNENLLFLCVCVCAPSYPCIFISATEDNWICVVSNPIYFVLNMLAYLYLKLPADNNNKHNNNWKRYNNKLNKKCNRPVQALFTIIRLPACNCSICSPSLFLSLSLSLFNAGRFSRCQLCYVRHSAYRFCCVCVRFLFKHFTLTFLNFASHAFYSIYGFPFLKFPVARLSASVNLSGFGFCFIRGSCWTFTTSVSSCSYCWLWFCGEKVVNFRNKYRNTNACRKRNSFRFHFVIKNR